MLYLNVAEGCMPTARILNQILTERGVNCQIQSPSGARVGDSIVCWGNSFTGRVPSLNRNAAQFDKLQQLRVLSSPESHNLRTVPFHPTSSTSVPPNTFYPAFMRKLSHAGGVDIRLALEPEHASLYTRNGWSFATKYIPNQKEFRIWVYRRQHLGTYEKILARPNEFLASRRFGANFDNGYSFQLVASENVPRAAVEMASAAVQALGLDFGAVDMLHGRDGQFYILEVNTAPGVEGPDRQVIQMLATKIAWWAEHRFPRRNGDESAYDRPGQVSVLPTIRTASALSEDEEEHDREVTTARETPNRPSFLPRPNETYAAWQARINA